MKLSEDYTAGTNVIRSYTGDHIEINNNRYSNSLIVSNTQLTTDWHIQHVSDMSHDDWQQLIQPRPEVIIVGTGDSLLFPHPSMYSPAIESGIGVEFMDSGAACRTYNILLSEDRFVIAAIILP